MNFLNSGKDKTPVTHQRGAYQIPCDWGNYYGGRTHQNFRKRVDQRKDDITKALNYTSANISLQYALSSQVFDNPNHKILFEYTSLINNDKGIKQVVREAIEIKLK